MARERGAPRIQLVLVAMLGASLSASAIAGGGGGRGGDSGDSSMNPFTGDSYAYFHGGHNLGEEAMILPWRKPVAKGVRNGSASAPTTTTKDRTAAAFRLRDAQHSDQRTDTQRSAQ